MAIQGPFILLVEDDARLRGIIHRNLQALGYFVLDADSFAQAANQIAIKPGLIILDIGLPDATGWDVVDLLESMTTPPPIIVTSAYNMDPRRIKQFSPVAVLHKPFDLDELLDLVQEYAPQTAKS